MDTGSFSGQMALNIKAILNIIIYMDLVSTFGVTGKNTKVNE